MLCGQYLSVSIKRGLSFFQSGIPPLRHNGPKKTYKERVDFEIIGYQGETASLSKIYNLATNKIKIINVTLQVILPAQHQSQPQQI